MKLAFSTNAYLKFSFAEAVRHGISVARKPQPQIVGKKSFDLGRDKSMLGNQVATAFAPVLHA
jgi:hypothetical protein